MLSEKMRDALNGQINHEFFSSYFYLAMSNWCEGKGLRGFGKWLRIQAQEEMSHAMIIYRYMGERDAAISLEAIEKPAQEFESLMGLVQSALKHEQGVTQRFHAITALAQEEQDFATVSFTRFFIDEQVEEEASFRDLIDQLKLVGNHGHAVFVLDREFGQRQFVLPTSLQNYF